MVVGVVYLSEKSIANGGLQLVSESWLWLLTGKDKEPGIQKFTGFAVYIDIRIKNGFIVNLLIALMTTRF